MNLSSSTKRARELRHESAPAERLLWSKLRAKRLNGLQFRRQHPIEGFFLDFYCAQHSLPIELDGDSHFDESGDAAKRDEVRTQILNANAIRVVRFTNTDIFENIDEVLHEVVRQCGANLLPK